MSSIAASKLYKNTCGRKPRNTADEASEIAAKLEAKYGPHSSYPCPYSRADEGYHYHSGRLSPKQDVAWLNRVNLDAKEYRGGMGWPSWYLAARLVEIAESGGATDGRIRAGGMVL